MKLALLADIHSNLEALSACLAHAEASGVERFAFLGDIVGYGADPVAVLDIVMAHAARGDAVVLGNHDEAAMGQGDCRMHENAMRAIEWTRGRLGRAHRVFLESLPLTVRDGDRLYVHASAAGPKRWTYVTDAMRAAHSLEEAGVPYVFSGHVHEQRLYFAGPQGRPRLFAPTPGSPIPVPPRQRWLAIVGSCGQPRDGNAAASYATLDADRARLTFHRIPYDHYSAARKIRLAGLPERLAVRLERGL